MSATRDRGRGFVMAALAACLAVPCAASAQSLPSGVLQAYKSVLETSMKEKRGLMFYVRGQQIGGGVVRLIGDDAVEIRNQTYGRIVIRLDQVEATAASNCAAGTTAWTAPPPAARAPLPPR